VLSIGRSSESDLQLLDLGVSRFHCVIESQAGGLVVTDLSSSNGTFVNGQRIKREWVDRGDEIELGTAKLVVERVPPRRRFVAAGLFTDRGGADARAVRRARSHTAALLEPLGAEAAGRHGPRLERQLAALFKINKELSAQVGIDRLLSIMMDTALEVIDAERGFLLLADPASREVVPKVVRVTDRATGGAEVPISRPVVRESMERRVSVFCPDLMAEARYHEGDRLLMEHVRAVLCTPLEAGGRVLGAIYFDTSSEGAPFDEHDLELLTALGGQAALALHRAQLVEDLERLFLGAIETLVATVEAKDIYTYGHSARVSKLAWQIAERIGLPEEEQETIRRAGLLHDVGKIGIPESILGKQGRLTEEEWAYIRSHPHIGESIIRQMGSERLAEVQQIVRHHHEHLDGGGYPDGLAGQAVPLGARILAVADAYDGMTSNRPYRKPFSSGAAIEELRRCAGSQFDRRAVEAIVEIRLARARELARAAHASSREEHQDGGG